MFILIGDVVSQAAISRGRAYMSGLYAIRTAMACLVGMISSQALAFDWSISAHVTVIEGSYMPTLVPFQIDAAAGSCAVGSWLQWNIRGSDVTSKNINAQSVEALLMTAKSSNQRVTVYGNNSGCTLDFIWLN